MLVLTIEGLVRRREVVSDFAVKVLVEVEAGEGVFLVEGELRVKGENCVRVKGFGAIKLVFSTKRSVCLDMPLSSLIELIVVYSKSLSVALSAVILSKISLSDSESFTWWLADWELLLGNSVTVVINVVADSGNGKFSVTDSVGRAMTL